ncbi:MAG: hypothetical protein MR762_08405 [Clostridiales bacterium]|nr:hypothetical protein [Clostridiales bacterium]
MTKKYRKNGTALDVIRISAQNIETRFYGVGTNSSKVCRLQITGQFPEDRKKVCVMHGRRRKRKRFRRVHSFA